MLYKYPLLVSILVLMNAASTRAEEIPAFSSTDLEFFENRVRPLLVEHCYECHSNNSEEAEGGLLLDSRQAAIKGGDTGPAIVPGKADESLLIDAVRYGDLYQMPPKSKLSEKEIEILVKWVNRQAPWPAGEVQHLAATQTFDLVARKNSHWAWQPIADPYVPKVADNNWPLDSLDHFILAKLEDKQLSPAPPTNAHALIRRAYFDLIGLPPPAEKITTFVANPSPQAYSALIDELLASPAFGQRWARHWLDLMRYAETRGHEFDYPIPNAWQYRDYVIRAFNADVPYDQFVTEHLAGDLIEQPRRHPEKKFNESILGTAFWYLGDWVHSPVDVRQDEMNRFDNAIDVFGKALLGLTVACARCHDHKFDAISQQDYYALAGYLQSSAYRQIRFETHEHNLAIATQLATLEKNTDRKITQEISNLARQLSQSDIEQLLAGISNLPQQKIWQQEIKKATDNEKHPLYPLALGLTSGDQTWQAWLQQIKNRSLQQLSETHTIVADYNNENTPWITDGPAFGVGPRKQADLILGSDWQRPIQRIVDRGFAQLHPQLSNLTLAKGTQRDPGRLHAWHVRPGRVLRTPSVQLRDGKLYYLMRGGAQVHAVVASHRMVQGPLHGSHLLDIPSSAELRWVEHEVTPYRGQQAHVEFAPRDNESLDVYLVVEGDKLPEFALDSPAVAVTRELKNVKTKAHLQAKYAELILESLHRLQNSQLSESPAHLVLAEWASSNLELWTNQKPITLQKLLDEYHKNRAHLLDQLKKESQTAPAIWDGPGENEFLLIRGNIRAPGAKVQRANLTALASPPASDALSSGRLQLAQQIASPENPLTARVITNRIWHHLMGRGIVPSVDDFGHLGQRPTHPELLDHLTQGFIREGWSIKSLIRRIMLSRTYQMSTQSNSLSTEVDPQNLLYHHMPTRRLQAEAIRDSLLSLSGKLQLKHTGPSIPVYLTSFMQGRGKPKENGPLDGNGRRSIYISVRRNFLSPMMLAFDAPQPNLPLGRRTVSNVPAQALILMNDPFVLEQAKLFAERLLVSTNNFDQAIHQLYLQALSRPPRSAEIAAAKEFVAAQIAAYQDDSQVSLLHPQAWADLCHTIFNTKEFIYLQ